MIKVIYHFPCFDGMGAYYAAWKKFGNEAIYIPHNYGEEKDLDLQRDDEIYLVDFSFKYDRMVRISEQVSRLTIIDHHKTAKEDLQQIKDKAAFFPNIEMVFDMSKSGAVLTWEYFHPDTEVPLVLQYVEDRDLWKWKLDRSSEINEGLTSLPLTLESWDGLMFNAHTKKMRIGKDEKAGIDVLCERGQVLLDRKKRVVESICQQTMQINLDGVTLPLVNTTEYMSDVGSRLSELCIGEPKAAAYFMVKKDKVVHIGLRSIGDYDVSAICFKFGGGGHKNAAGFTTTLDALVKLLV